MSNEIKEVKARYYKLAQGDNLEVVGLPIKITNENLKNPNVIKAIQNCEQRTGRKIIGTLVVLA